MITNKKLGLKIAEDSEEALWERLRKSTEERIKNTEDMLMIDRAILEMAKEKLKKWKK